MSCLFFHVKHLQVTFLCLKGKLYKAGGQSPLQIKNIVVSPERVEGIRVAGGSGRGMMKPEANGQDKMEEKIRTKTSSCVRY